MSYLHNAPESFQDRAFVRFRAMIQDTSASPEMYLAEADDHKYGGWGAAHDTPAEIDYENLRECSVFWAVSIPGESDWVGNRHSQQSVSTSKPSQSHKYPVPAAHHVGMQLKVYDTSAAETLKTTDIATFVGLLTSEPLQHELEVDNPKTVPTLHVLFHKGSIADLRNEVIEWIAREALADDKEAAEWVLLSCIARVQSRAPPILPPTLTLSRFPSSTGPSSPPPTLHAVLAYLFPSVSLLPLSLETINQTPFMPESREEDLHSGWLQLPRGNICLVTESGVTEGGVNEKGVLNLRATQESMIHQMLDYVFPFSSYKFETDITWIVLSEGRKSAFFQTDINFPLNAESSSDRLYKPKEDVVLPAQDRLEAFRNLVCSSKIGTTGVAEDAAEYIQNDFVNQRKVNSDNTLSTSAAKPTVTADDLIQKMMVAKSLALSLHESEVTVDIWKRMKELDMKRVERVERMSDLG
ncbi:hypothetical protein D9758_003140 [Tetrapyrgos nigripes]|uniref:Mini-chromosome maintenance complex-binding protein n=1 Tax=Tetrapyrgos nigripes TaxID=182062 RepID=A0A8H5LQE6_9AGAR|nr:hypothetical protein D9758_003140 [Tetrapyrgos nigripes]